ncbi:hypothetical protein C7Y69_09660 [Alteromonas sp. KS69]|jgi:MSHA biogenesis protein MshO|uniref:prepilin-type N-terminal cleavage/methylation domain-containing protein n=1 Tax=unclassified Alteromonas TaxID=2614992 RepID=UPI000C10B7B7|nr:MULTISPECIES: prepilin-type N-terminal cleavage/methylation domain-containing protein [unclassified Alteromonas]MBB67350.1 hypothetical protein [Rickettsiales bacterium]MBO7923788.1 prepilin-type N-terminal cleavage/methylation domain-containing protein [Alteromonas sp. K632G]PHS57097.1 MAG: hypothetical protein COB03_06235 [Alteromonas sp.]RUP81111.1 hypothetical protein C7Y69_09660 [Alteromonas sp. KS69]|tara:strand:+ start:6733 stop:7596 length:864 start_codon:yes stop_codon:yes gene_type:complete
MANSTPMNKARGFTLVELVIVLVVMGVIATGIAKVVTSSMSVFVGVSEREQLVAQTSFAINRMARELQNAVPASVRVRGSSSQHCLQFVPADVVTGYSDISVQPATENTIDILFPADALDNTQPFTASASVIVAPPSVLDVYNAANDYRQPIVSCTDDGDGDCATRDSTDDTLEITVSDAFAEASLANRAYIASKAVSFCLRGSVLHRIESGFTTSQPLALASSPRLGVDFINVLSASPASGTSNDDPFQVRSVNGGVNNMVMLRLRAQKGDEVLSLTTEVAIENEP